MCLFLREIVECGSNRSPPPPRAHFRGVGNILWDPQNRGRATQSLFGPSSFLRDGSPKPPPGLQAFGRKQVLSATHPWGAGSNDVLVWVLQKQTLNKQIQEQVVYLAGDPK